jgi:hypothetical protein
MTSDSRFGYLVESFRADAELRTITLPPGDYESTAKRVKKLFGRKCTGYQFVSLVSELKSGGLVHRIYRIDHAPWDPDPI